MKLTAFLITASLCSCSPEGEELITSAGSGTLETATHDGHKFIIYEGYRSGNAFHHPSCDCLKTPERP